MNLDNGSERAQYRRVFFSRRQSSAETKLCKPGSTERLAYTCKELAQRLGVSEGMVRQWVQRGHLASFKISRRRFVVAPEVDSLNHTPPAKSGT